MDSAAQKILLLGGYGRAGKQVSKLLFEHSNMHLTIAGQTKSKAEDWTSSLNQNLPTQRVNALRLDISNVEKLINILPDFHLLIISAPYPENRKPIINAIIKSGTDYIDLVPDSSKNRYFEEHHSEIQSKGMTCILEAGWEPGLPALLTRLAHRKLNNETQNVEIHAIYRDRSMPTGSIADILTHANLKQKVYKNNEWKQVSISNTTTMSLPQPFGKVTGFPTELAELQQLPNKLDLNSLKLYQGGHNWLSDLVLFLLTIFGSKKGSFTFNQGVKLFRWANQRFTTPASAGIVKVIASNEDQSVTMTAINKDLYQATAIPVVASVLLMDQGVVTPGVGFMGHKLPPQQMEALLAKMGISIKTSTKRV